MLTFYGLFCVHLYCTLVFCACKTNFPKLFLRCEICNKIKISENVCFLNNISSSILFQIGPGIVYLDFDSFFGRGIFLEILTPVEPMVQRLSHNIYMHWAVPNFITKFYMNALAIQV